jgi:hypothetical protein
LGEIGKRWGLDKNFAQVASGRKNWAPMGSFTDSPFIADVATVEKLRQHRTLYLIFFLTHPSQRTRRMGHPA